MWSAAGRGSAGPETAGTEAWRCDGLGSAGERSGGVTVSAGRVADGALSGHGRTLRGITGFSAVL